jgi:hypothetical protein
VRCKQHFSDHPEFREEAKDVMMELKGRAHYVPNEPDPKILFVVAKSYPSKSVAV